LGAAIVYLKTVFYAENIFHFYQDLFAPGEEQAPQRTAQRDRKEKSTVCGHKGVTCQQEM
jgi:hypothetical protein